MVGLGGVELPDLLKNAMEQRKKKEWASWAEQEYVRCRQARLPFERQWFLNIAFYSGRQYLSPINVPGHGFRLTAPKAPPWRVRIVVNKVRTAVRTECSKLTSSKPLPTVVPATTEDEDYTAARVAEQILKTEFNTGDFDRTIRSWIWWGVVTGNAFIKSYWNPKEIDDKIQPAPQPNPMGPMFPEIKQEIPGKICYERVNPFHIFVPDLLAEDIEKQPYIIHATTRSKLWVDQNFGINSTPDTRAANTIMEAAVLAPAGANNQHFDSVMVKEVWLKPNAHKDFPEGGVLTVINGECVQVQDKWPWPFKDYPFYKYDGIPTGGFYTDSIVTDLIPIQKEYNRTKSQMIEIKNTMGKPKILAARGSINPKMISSEPGQAILYTPGFDRPTVLPAVEVPATMGIELDRLSSDFDDISGQHEITRGNTPAQVTSGTAISFLQEQDDSKLAYQVAGIEHAIEKLGSHYLKYVQTYWQDGRLIRVVGSDGMFEAIHWKQNSLKGNTDVIVQAGSALPQSKAARTAMISEFMNNGQMDPQTGMEMLEMPGLEKVVEDFLVDKRQAQRENLKLASADPMMLQQLQAPPVGPDGQPMMGVDPSNPTGPPIPYDPMTQMPWQPQPVLPVNSFDNHEVHIHFHNQYRKTQAYEILDDAIKKEFELHVQGHQMAMQMPNVGMGGIPVQNADMMEQQQGELPQDDSMQEEQQESMPSGPPA